MVVELALIESGFATGISHLMNKVLGYVWVKVVEKIGGRCQSGGSRPMGVVVT